MIVLAIGHSAHAESGRAVNLMAGFAFVFPSADNAPKGSGIGQLGAAEYVFRLTEEAVTFRPYAGVLRAVPAVDCNKGVQCELSAKIGFAGGKLRVLAPIPYVAPFLELGVGVSAGEMTTRIGSFVDERFSGVTYHVPVAIGLGFGKHHEAQLSFQYLFHPVADEFCGAVAFAAELPLSGARR